MSRAAPRTRMSTGELMRRLRSHYVRQYEMFPGGFLAEEVGENGALSSQRVDAVYVGFTSASGRIMIGHELKVSRADWQHELEQLHKADRWADACHAWFYVAPDTIVIAPEEVPHGAGLMIPDPRRPTKMKVIIPAAVKTDHDPPWWAVRSVMARQDTMRGAHVQRLVERQLQQAQEKAVQDYIRQQVARLGDVDPHQVLSEEDRSLLRVAQGFRDRGVDLGLWEGRGGHTVTPGMLAPPFVEALAACRDVEQLRERLAGRYSDLPRVAELVGELTTAVAKLGAS